ncbi:hypothetical protein BGZ80_003033 [Entomortierella chlamydospora]|uniref:Arm-like repeat domain-containing protein n=1 Tax=Entomortierella chlamydospora TaxID=101097 RepID=A0A9P6N1Z2_9FUNG|nr:hypothetical protein BGZ80_003033 [Entomortierella chlamydospora]
MQLMFKFCNREKGSRESEAREEPSTYKNMGWNLFSSPTSKLPLGDILELANKYLELARKGHDPSKAVHLCRNAKSLLKDAETVFSKGPKDPILKDGIAKAYHEHGKLLDELGYHEKAQRSLTKAEAWGYIPVVSQHIDTPRPDHLSGSSGRSPNSSDAIPDTHQSMQESDISQPGRQSPGQDVTLTKVKDDIPESSENVVPVPKKIFDQNVIPPVARYTLPGVGERITSTPQLAYCLGLLQPSLVSKEGLSEIESDWSRVRTNDPDEQQRLQTMATDLIRAFVRDELKMPGVVAEVVSLAAVLDKDNFRKLLQIFVDGIDQSVLLNVHLLEGLAQLMRNAVEGYINADDLVKTLKRLNALLNSTDSQSSRHVFQLTLTISNVLDGMVDSQVEGIPREQLHEPLSKYLEELQESPDPYLVYQAAYASQAMMYISDDEPFLQTALRRTGKVVQGISGLVSAVKALDLVGFVEGLQSIQEGLAGVGKVVNNAYSNATTLAKSGQSLLQSLKEGSNFSGKRAWYPALRGLDRLIQEGRFAEFEKLIREAPCSRDPAFQWGVCQRLGEIAANNVWDVNTRQCAVDFLGEMYEDDATWGQQTSIKQWILQILNQLADPSMDALASQAQTLLQGLERGSSTEKSALFQVYKKSNSGPYPIVVTRPPQESRLLDGVQNKPDVETPLRQLKRERLRDRDRDVYISPRAKVSQKATDDFDLTSKVQEFLESDRKVLLLLGDSGSGKSTFNRALEISLWDKYTSIDRPIPLFIHLPSIDKPEHDMVAKQLRRFDFTESQIKELKSYRKFIVICDGYDESQQTRNLYVSNELNRPGQWQAQMVISCRTEYNGVDYKDCFQPTDRNNPGNTQLFEEAFITPFNNGQIQDYVERYVLLNKPPWESKDYEQAFQQVPDLRGLVTNPFLLRIALDVLPRLLGSSSELSKARITRVGLYDEFVAEWIERSKMRHGEIELNPRDKTALKAMSVSGFKKHGITYLKKLVTAVYDHQGSNPVINYSEYEDKKTWKGTFFNENDGVHLLREAVPLARNGGQYRFIHKSVLEYGLALTVFDPSEYSKNNEPTPATSDHEGTCSTPSLESAPITIDLSLLDSPLGKRSLLGEPSILLFLKERAQQEPIFKDQLRAIVLLSKTDESVCIAAANAITILVRAGVQFNRVDLRGIKIPGADLRFGVFDSALLEGADLRNVNLGNVWLRQASLNGAQMMGVQFGELPSLLEDSDIKRCVFSPDGKIYAVGTQSGKISLYDSSSWIKIRSLEGHKNGMMSLAFSATSDRIVTGGNEGAVRVWDVDSGECIHDLDAHINFVCVVAYSPRGGQIVSASYDKSLKFWSTDSGKCIHKIQDIKCGVDCAVYSPDGDQVATGNGDGTVQLWDPSSGDRFHILQGHTESVNCVVYSPKGNRIASAAKDRTVRIWDVVTGECLHTFQGHSDVVYSPKGNQIASGGGGKTVRLWDADSGDCVHVLKCPEPVSSIVYSPKGDQVASWSYDSPVRLWDVVTGACANTIRHDGLVYGISYSLNGNQIASWSLGKTVRLWDVNVDDVAHPIQRHEVAVTSVACSPKGGHIASGSKDGNVRLWEADTGNCVHTLQCHSGLSASIVYSPNGHQIASGGYDKAVRLWDADTGDCVHTLLGHESEISALAYSPDGNQIISGNSGCWGSTECAVRLWDVGTGKCIHVLLGHKYGIHTVVYSTKGNRIASGDYNSTMRLWDANTGDCIHIIQEYGRYDIVFSPKGVQVASGTMDNALRLWDVDTGDCIHILHGHTHYVRNVAYSPKGDQIASGSIDGTARLWDVVTGDCIHILQDHCYFLAFSPSGDQILSGCSNFSYSSKLWDVASGRCLLSISDFDGRVGCAAWENTTDGQYIVTGCHDKSVRRWQITKAGGKHQAVLCWTSSNEVLTVSNATFENVQGLDGPNRELLRQRGALIKNLSTLGKQLLI